MYTPVTGVIDGVDPRIDARSEFTGATWNHGHQRSQSVSVNESIVITLFRDHIQEQTINLFPKHAVSAINAYGVQEIRKRTVNVMPTLAMRISADCSFASTLLRNDVTFIFLAWARNWFSCSRTLPTILL